MQNMMDRLLSNLHPGINNDPQALSAISVTGNGTIIIKNEVLQLIGSSASAQYNLRSYTISSLVSSINSVSGFSATSLVSQGRLSAATLLSGTFTSPCKLQIFSSFLWQVLKPVAIALLDALGAENNALLEMIVNTSDGTWLDSFGELFGVVRLSGEPDQLYAIRIFDLSVGVRNNNYAIQKVLQDLQYTSTVADGGANAFTVSVTLPLLLLAPQGFYYTIAQMQSIIDLLRPAGITYTISSQGNLVDTAIIGDSISYTTSNGPAKWGSGRKWGKGIWGT